MREILMIDDKFSKWHPILEGAAIQNSFNITNTPSVEEGLKKLKEYPGGIDAVILGLTFAKGKMQGREGLIKIIEVDNYIPVVILTAKTDDFQLISECIRLGAYDYFSKPNINPDLLFLQIENAIRESVRRKKHRILVQKSTDENAQTPYFFSSEQKDNTFRGYFAYRLFAIVCPSFDNKAEAEYLNMTAREWHSSFLNSLTFYNSNLTLRLRYLYNPGSEYIDTVLVVELTESSFEQATLLFNEMHNELDTFMQAKRDFGKTIYYFSPIVEESDLKKVLFPFNSDTLFQFIPEFTELTHQDSKNIGYSTSSKSKEKIKLSFPLLLKQDFKMERLFEQLVNQKTRTMVEIALSPERLKGYEIDYLRKLIFDIDSYKLTQPEKENMNNTISSYLNVPSKCFKVEIFEAQESKRIGENMLAAISASFYENATHITTSPVKVNKIDILKKEEEEDDVRKWNYLYSLSNILNVFKFPYPYSTSVSGIRSYNPVFGYIPENLSKTGIIAGVKNMGGDEVPVRISPEDLRKHLYILGQTGTGKTTLLYSMIMDRIVAGKGVCVIDPHGDLYERLLKNIPKKRKKDVIQFDPGRADNDIRINLLEYDKNNPQEKSFLIDDLFNFFRQEYDVNVTMGPVFELFMKNSLLLLMGDPNNIGNIGDVVTIFQNEMYRDYLIAKCRDQEVIDFWKETAAKLTGEHSLANFTPYITSKLNQLLINEYIRPIVATHASNINFREVIDNDKILLVSLSKGKIGKIGVNILGTVVLSRIVNASMSRHNIPEEKRKDYVLFVDEFHNFVSHSIMYAMSEARKYRLSLVLANQTLGQLNEGMKQSVLGNVGSTVFFRPGINDVDYIMPYFSPYLTKETILTLPNYSCIGRMQIDNTLSLPFIFDTLPPERTEAMFKECSR